MFYNSKATSIDVTNYYTKNTELFIGMFDSSQATEIIGLSNLDVSKATSLFRVFRNMTNITVLDLTGWDTTAATATNFGNMFNGDSSLRTIYASNKFVIPNGATTTSMFGNCGNLKGGAGTPYDATYVAGTRAKIDGGAGDEGYFTQGPPPSN